MPIGGLQQASFQPYQNFGNPMFNSNPGFSAWNNMYSQQGFANNSYGVGNPWQRYGNMYGQPLNGMSNAQYGNPYASQAGWGYQAPVGGFQQTTFSSPLQQFSQQAWSVPQGQIQPSPFTPGASQQATPYANNYNPPRTAPLGRSAAAQQRQGQGAVVNGQIVPR